VADLSNAKRINDIDISLGSDHGIAEGSGACTGLLPYLM
jgi:hypothetical protein